LKTSSSTLGPALVLLCVVLAYSNSFSGAFLLDDHRRIVHNPDIRSLGKALSRSERPVLNATFWLNYAADGVRPEGYHLFNVALHACSALILYGLVKRILESGRFGPASSRAAASMGLLVAALWGVHPLATSGVNYISQRAESLMGFFYLLALYASLRAAAGSRRSASVGWGGLAVGACALGMGTKQVMVTAPVMVVFVESIVLFGGSFRDAFRQRWRFYACMGATWLVLVGGGRWCRRPIRPSRWCGGGYRLSCMPLPRPASYCATCGCLSGPIRSVSTTDGCRRVVSRIPRLPLR